MVTWRHADTDLHYDINLTFKARIVIWNTLNYIKNKKLTYTTSVADLHSKIVDMRPPGGPNSFNFMQFLGNFDEIVCWHPPRGVGTPSSGKS